MMLPLVALLMASAIPTTLQQPSLSRYVGAWTITAIVGSGDMSVSEAEARRPLGKTLIIGEKTASFAGEKCTLRSSAKVSRLSRRETDDVLRDARAQRSYIRLKGDILEPEPIYIDDDCVTAFVTKKGHLVVLGYTGYFYEAARAELNRP